MSYDYFDKLPRDAKERYETKLSSIGLSVCPYRLPADSWINDPTAWPDIQFADVYMYLTSTPGVYTHQAMKDYKSLEAHRYFTAGFVQTVFHMKTSTQFIIFRASVRPSQRTNDPSHQPWVAVKSSGEVQAGHCTCMAGLGESCSHVAALLFKREAAVRLGVTSIACTSKPCEWNNYHSDKVQPAPIHTISFYNKEAIDKVELTRRKRRPTSEMHPPSDEEQHIFLKILTTNERPPVALSLFSSTSATFRSSRTLLQPPRLPTTLRSNYKETHTDLSPSELKSKCEDLASSLRIDQYEAEYLEEKTWSQANSTIWHEHRAGRITASSAHTVLHTNQDKPAPSVVLRITKPNPIPINAAPLIYGREKESEVFKLAAQYLEQIHDNCQMSHCGMVVSKEMPWLSASADGLVNCTCHGKRVLEIKCPYSARDQTVEEFLSDSSSYMFGGTLKKSHEYYTQVQLEMYVHDVEMCEFVVLVKDSLIQQTVPRDEDYLADIIPALELFWKRHITHELLTRSIELENSKKFSSSKVVLLLQKAVGWCVNSRQM